MNKHQRCFAITYAVATTSVFLIETNEVLEYLSIPLFMLSALLMLGGEVSENGD